MTTCTPYIYKSILTFQLQQMLLEYPELIYKVTHIEYKQLMYSDIQL